MARYLFIVARGHPDLYADLQRQFAQNPEIEVLVDRRYSERREAVEPHQPERRSLERRGQRSGAGPVLAAGPVAGLPLLIVELAPAPAS